MPAEVDLMDQADSGDNRSTEKSGKQLGWAALAAFNAVSFLVLTVVAARGVQFPTWVVATVFLSVAVTQFACSLRWLCGDRADDAKQKVAA